MPLALAVQAKTHAQQMAQNMEHRTHTACAPRLHRVCTVCGHRTHARRMHTARRPRWFSTSPTCTRTKASTRPSSVPQSTSAPRGRCESATAWQRLGATAWERQPGSAAAAAAAEVAAAAAAAACVRAPPLQRPRTRSCTSVALGRRGGRGGRGGRRASCAPSRAPSRSSTPPHRLNDSTRYFFERAADILSSTYLPTEQDSLRARVRTTGIVQQHFEIKERKYTMFDVGGQRNERRKWIHCFDNVTACIFVTAISEFDQKLYEV